MASQSFTFEGLSSMGDMLVQWYGAAKSEAEAMAQAANSAAQSSGGAAIQWDQVADKAASLVDHIQDTIHGLKYSEFNLQLPIDRLATATEDYGTMLEAAQTGDEEDVKAFTSFINTYLESAKAEFASGQQFVDIFDKVMSDLAELETGTQTMSEQAQIAASTQQIANASMEIQADLTSINATFEQIATWIEGKVEGLEQMSVIMEIDWSGLDGDALAVMDMMSKVVDEHGWNSDVTMTFVSEMADNFTGDFEDNMELLNYISTGSGWESDATLMFLADSQNFDTEDIDKVFEAMNLVRDQSGGWETPATVAFLSNESAFSLLTLEDKMAAFGFVGSDAGWESSATTALVANLSNQGLPWSAIQDTLTGYGVMDDTIEKTILGAYYSSTPDFNSWEKLSSALTLAGLDDVTMKTIQGNYTGNMPMADLHQLLSAAGVSDNVIATINEQVQASVSGQVDTDLEPGMDGLNNKMAENNLSTAWLSHIHSYLGLIYDRLVWLKPIYDYQALIYNSRVLSNNRGYAYGGVASGPESGWQATLHGTEVVISPKASYDNVSVLGGMDFTSLTATIQDSIFDVFHNLPEFTVEIPQVPEAAYASVRNDRKSNDNKEEIELLKQIVANQQQQIQELKNIVMAVVDQGENQPDVYVKPGEEFYRANYEWGKKRDRNKVTRRY